MFPDWTGETAIVVATGPSAADAPLEKAKGRAQFLVVKDGWKLAPWASHLYACDHHWWEQYQGVKEFKGTRVVYDKRTVDKYLGLDMIKIEIEKHVPDMRFDKPGYVGWGGNSGFHAINLAAQWGAKKIILIGFDMRVDKGRHFFGDHPYSAVRPSEGNMRRWVPHLDKQAPILKARGIDVVNCSQVSALTAYPKMTLEEAIA